MHKCLRIKLVNRVTSSSLVMHFASLQVAFPQVVDSIVLCNPMSLRRV